MRKWILATWHFSHILWLSHIWLVIAIEKMVVVSSFEWYLIESDQLLLQILTSFWKKSGFVPHETFRLSIVFVTLRENVTIPISISFFRSLGEFTIRPPRASSNDPLSTRATPAIWNVRRVQFPGLKKEQKNKNLPFLLRFRFRDEVEISELRLRRYKLESVTPIST